jgi:hypothetical protein
MSEIPLEQIGSGHGFAEAAVAEPQVAPEVPSQVPAPLPVQEGFAAASGPSLSRRISSALCCSCGCDTSAQSTPFHQVPYLPKVTNIGLHTNICNLHILHFCCLQSM